MFTARSALDATLIYCELVTVVLALPAISGVHASENDLAVPATELNPDTKFCNVL